MQLVDFLNNYWQFISFGLLVILQVIFMIIKKRSSVNVIDNSSYSSIIQWIKEAEDLFGPGEGHKKLAYVSDLLIQRYKMENSPFSSIVLDYAENVVNEILDTPQRKKDK